MKYIRDAIHGEIEITDEVKQMIDHPLFQRLRRISQLSLSWYVYPSARHTRFEHSLGVYHITRHINERTAIYGLLHDVGHGPFSHLTEIALASNGYYFDHEKNTRKMAKEILSDSTYSFKEIFHHKENIFVDGGVGTDRMDYLMRDSYFTGVKVGFISWERLVRSMWLEEGRLTIAEKVIPNAEHLFIARFILGDSVYFHKTALVVDTMYSKAVGELLEYYKPEEILSMDDYDVVHALRRIGSRWWKLIEDRRLFKAVFRGNEEEAKAYYEKMVEEFGEEDVLLVHRPAFYSKPEVYVEGGKTLIEVSPLIRSLRKAEESRIQWFVAVNPSLIKEGSKFSTSLR